MAEDVKVVLGVDPSTESNVQGWFNGKTFDVKLKPDTEFAKQLETAVKSAQNSASKASSKAMETAQSKAAKSWADQQSKQIQQLAKEQAKALSDAQRKALQETNSKTLSNNMSNWLKSNTQYAEKYGDAVANLQQRLAEAAKAGDSAAYKQISAEWRELQSEAKSTAVSVADLGQALKQALGGTALGALAKSGVALAVRELRMAAREMVSSAVEIESALAQLQVVTGASGSQLDQFFDAAASSAKNFGVEVKDMLGSIETFSRLGFQLDDALGLSEAATTLGNVANMTVDAATTGMVSAIKGFGLDPSDASRIADVVTKIGQSYAIAGDEIMVATEKAGSALHAAGLDFEQSAALMAAANSSVQNANTVGTMLKTLSARIRGSKTELEELGEDLDTVGTGMSKYRDEIKALTNVDGTGGFDIMADEAGTQYKNLYDIVVGIADVWNDMSDVSQARVAELLGGTRGLTIVNSLVQNIDDAKAALQDAYDAAGTAAEANAIVMDTTEKRVEVLKTSFQTLSKDIISSDLTKGIVDFGTKAIDVIDSLVNKFGALPVALGALAGLDIVKNLGKSYCPARAQVLVA